VRRAILSAAVLGIALMLQLTVVNRLPLPGAGAPDLVLLTVVALGLCGGPAGGALTGFCAGLALDIAPPGSYLVGQYALVFCLVGYLCGRLRGIANRSALLTIAAAMAAAAIGEALSAAFGLAVSNPQVTWPAVRLVLPSSIVYDVVLAPFVLYLVVRAMHLVGGLARDAAAQPADGAALLARNQAAGNALPGGSRSGAGALGGAGLLGGVGWVSGPVGSRRSRGPRAPRTAAAPRTPRLGDAAARRGDGWLGSAPRTALSASRAPAARPGRAPRLRPGTGTAGSAVARPPRPLPRPPVNLRLGAASRRDGSVGRGLGGPAGPALGRRPKSGPPGSAFRGRRPGVAGPAALARPGAAGRGSLSRKALSPGPRFRPDPHLRGGSASPDVRRGAGPARVRPSRRVSLRLGSARRYDGALGGSVLGRRALSGGVAGRGGPGVGGLRGSALRAGGPRRIGLRSGALRGSELRTGRPRGSGLRGGGLPRRALRGGRLRGGGLGGGTARVPGSGRGLAARPVRLRLGSGRRGGALGGLRRRGPWAPSRLSPVRPAAPRFRSAVPADGYLAPGRRGRLRAPKRVRLTRSSFLATWTGGLLGHRSATGRIGKRTGGLR
jgi:rod shape-determining protein MreD